MKGTHSRRKRTGGKRGGSSAPDPSSYASGATYGLAVNGTSNSQFDRVMNQGGPSGTQTNTIVGLQGQKAGRRGRSRGRRGGYWGSVLNQAVVPFSILAAQQTYRKKRGGNKTRRVRGGKKH